MKHKMVTRLEQDLIDDLDTVAEERFNGNRTSAVRTAVRRLIMNNADLFQTANKSDETATAQPA